MIRKNYRPIMMVFALAAAVMACSLGGGAEPSPTAPATLPISVPTGSEIAGTPTQLVLVTPLPGTDGTGGTGGTPAQPIVPPTVGGLITATNVAGANNGGAANTGAAANTGGVAANTGGTTGTCPQPNGWIVYTVQAGDSVSSLAQRTNTTTEQLTAANCLTNADVINTGQVVYLPTAPTGVSVAANGAANGAANSAANSAANAAGGVAGANTTGGSVTTGTTIQNVWVEPAMVLNNGQYQVTPGTALTVRANGVTNATQVTFVWQPIGSNVTPTTIGVDSNLADGASVPWTVNDANLNANLWAIVTNSANENTQSQPVVVFSRQGTTPWSRALSAFNLWGKMSFTGILPHFDPDWLDNMLN
jgi:LysM repeat protein